MRYKILKYKILFIYYYIGTYANLRITGEFIINLNEPPVPSILYYNII